MQKNYEKTGEMSNEDGFGGEGWFLCRSCGGRLNVGDGYYEKDGKPYCEDCVEAATLSDLVRICEAEEVELAEAIGLSHGYIEGA